MYLMLLMPHYLLVHTLILGTFAPATRVVFSIISFNRISSVMMYLSRGKWNMLVLFKSWRQNCCWRTALWSLSPLRISIGFYLKRPLSSTNSAFCVCVWKSSETTINSTFRYAMTFLNWHPFLTFKFLWAINYTNVLSFLRTFYNK